MINVYDTNGIKNEPELMHIALQTLFGENEKLKQALQEIKEIAEKGFNNSQCNCGALADLESILDIITKVGLE